MILPGISNAGFRANWLSEKEAITPVITKPTPIGTTLGLEWTFSLSVMAKIPITSRNPPMTCKDKIQYKNLVGFYSISILYCVSIAFILRLTATNICIDTSINSNNLLINTWNYQHQYTVLPVYKVGFKGLTGALKKISDILQLSFNVPASRNVRWNCLTRFWIFAPILLSSSRD